MRAKEDLSATRPGGSVTKPFKSSPLERSATRGRLAAGREIVATPAELEHEADGSANELVHAAPGGAPLVRAENGKRSLGPGWQTAFERALGRDLSSVRIVDDAAAQRRAHQMGAQAVALGPEITVTELACSAGSQALARTLAHEITHVAQQGAVPVTANARPLHRARVGVPQLQEATRHQPAAPVEAPSGVSLQVPPDWVQTAERGYMLLTHGGHVVALPAAASLAFVRPPPTPRGPEVAAQPAFTLPTIGKEGMVAVNVGGRVGFMVDAGGRPAIVWPGAMQAIQQALGISRISQVVITHVHVDHIQALEAVIRSNSIPPQNLHFPAEFENHPPFRAMPAEARSRPGPANARIWAARRVRENRHAESWRGIPVSAARW